MIILSRHTQANWNPDGQSGPASCDSGFSIKLLRYHATLLLQSTYSHYRAERKGDRKCVDSDKGGHELGLPATFSSNAGA
jgi:hypothetical protein